MVTRIDPHAAGSTRHSAWWVVQQQLPGKGQSVPVFNVVMATSKPMNAVAGPFTSKSAADNVANQKNNQGTLPVPNLNPFSWLGSLGGMIGSGIEAGFISVFKDLWDVVIGPLEVLIGGIIIVVTLMMYFRHDIINLASSIGGIAAAAA